MAMTPKRRRRRELIFDAVFSIVLAVVIVALAHALWSFL
jgi:hypothetical protein